jgi:hypothetical protein
LLSRRWPCSAWRPSASWDRRTGSERTFTLLLRKKK